VPEDVAFPLDTETQVPETNTPDPGADLEPGDLQSESSVVPGAEILCKPCKTDEDCTVESTAGNQCIDRGADGRFCGIFCSEAVHCPDGYECASVGGDLSGSHQCQPSAATCPCPDTFKPFMTICYAENEFGRCEAERSCDATCPADLPAAETCNGRDDNCDGQTDEGLGSTTCGNGICAHTVQNCMGGIPQNCDPMEGSTTELCNGLDDNCDSQTDEEPATLCGGGSICYQDACCTPSCSGAPCGDDGCGGFCGGCADGSVCHEGSCCKPDCEGKACGDDGCGGQCGKCELGQTCQSGSCCTPDCQGKSCGDDGCGGSCGSCDGMAMCVKGICCATLPASANHWQWITGSCIKLVDTPTDWSDAEAQCKLQGAHLAVIGYCASKWEAETRNKEVAQLGPDGARWIGLSDVDLEGTFQWVTGQSTSTIGYSNTFWAFGEPNNQFGKEDCVQMLGDGSWNDADCSMKLPFVCQIEQ